LWKRNRGSDECEQKRVVVGMDFPQGYPIKWMKKEG
jgi:hypothetical protein